jgi:hypothetical protein
MTVVREGSVLHVVNDHSMLVLGHPTSYDVARHGTCKQPNFVVTPVAGEYKVFLSPHTPFIQREREIV